MYKRQSPINRVPLIKGRTPNPLDVNNGVHFVPVKNSMGLTSAKKENPSMQRIATIPIVVTTVTEAHKNSRIPMRRPPKLFLRFCLYLAETGLDSYDIIPR